MSDEPYDLPRGWARTSLGKLVELKYGKGLPARLRDLSGETPVYGSNGVVGRHLKALTGSPVIVIGRKGSVGEVHLSAIPCWPIDTTYFVDDFPNGLDPRFVFQYLKSQRLRDLDRSTAVPGINREDLYRLPLPIAPPAEQRKIVAKIEHLFEQSRTARAALDRIPPLLKKFRQAVLAAAFRGDLTRDWRGQNPNIEPASVSHQSLKKSHSGRKKGNAAAPTEGVHILEEVDFPKSWVVALLADLCDPIRPITYGILKPGPHVPNGVPYVRVADMRGEKIVLDGIKRTTRTIDEAYKRSRLNVGDILLSIRGTVGRVCRVPDELEAANITQDTARISVDPRVSASYVAICLRSPIVQSVMAGATKGVAVRGINIGDVRALQVPLPPLEEQRHIVERVDSLMTQADAIEAAVEAARRRADKLEQSILARAFRGELVPQDPNDEPASTLLDRIHAARAKSDIKKRPRA